MSKKKRALTGVAKVRDGRWKPPDIMQTLVQCGVKLPEECCSVELNVSADSLMQITYTCNVSGALAHKIGKALQVQAVKERLT